MSDEQTLRASRMVFAPEESVYAAMTDPKQLALWLVAEEFSVKFHAFDLRPGGGYRLTVRQIAGTTDGADGIGAITVRGRFIDLVNHHRIVQRVEFESAPAALTGAMRIDWTIEDEPAGACAIIKAGDLPRGIDRDVLMEHLNAALERLSSLVERQPNASIVFAESGARSC